MDLYDIQFRGLLGNRQLIEITGPEFSKALKGCGWKEGKTTHFLRELRKDGPSRGIFTPIDLVRAIAKGESTPVQNGKTIHRMCNRTAYIIYNARTKVLITFSQGNPSEKSHDPLDDASSPRTE